MTEIYGHCDEAFAPVRVAFEKNFIQDNELGGAFSLIIDGETVVDLWGGFRDETEKLPWERDTLVPVSSTTKIVAALCALIVLDRGLIELDTPVAHYWPEFAANGKADIPVRYLFSHNSGLAGLDPPVEMTDFQDWDSIVKRLAKQAPWWEPGTGSGYHGMTFGFLLGELVRRTTGLDFQDFLKQEVTGPLEADFHIGISEAEFERLASIVSRGEPRSNMAGSMARRAQPFDYRNVFKLFKSLPFLSSVIPSGNGVGTARAIAQIGNALVDGQNPNNVSLLSAETRAQIIEEQSYTHDLVMDMPVRFGLGFGLAGKEFPLPFPKAFHWGGYGGSCAIMEPDRKASFSYVTNLFDSGLGVDSRGARLNKAAINCLERV